MNNVTSASKFSSWLIGPRIDTFFILMAGPTISVGLFWAIWHGPAFLIGAALFALLLDIPHLLHTYITMLSNPYDFARYRRPLWTSLIVISLLCVGLAVTNQFVVLVTIWVYWQPYHICKQHFGVAAMYARKAGYRGSTGHVKLLMFAGMVAPLLYRLVHGGFKFGHYVFFGNTMPFSDLSVYTPPIPSWSVWLAYAIFLSAAIRYVWREWADARRGQALPWFVWVMIGISLALYNVAYLMIQDLYALILIGTSMHVFQYHLVCVATVKAKLPFAEMPPDASRVLLWFHERVKAISRNPWYWAGTLFISSLLVAATEFPTLGIVLLIFVLHHFYLDGVIWKRKAQ